MRGMGRSIGKQALQVRIVKRRSFDPIVLALALIVLTQGFLQLGQRIDLLLRDHLGRHCRQPRHQPLDILQLLEHRPALVAVGPCRIWCQPNCEGLRKVLIRMALRIPHIEVPHEAPAIGPGAVIFGIGFRRASKDLLPKAEAAEAIGIFYGVACLMPQDAHAPVRGPALDLEHLVQFQFREARMGQIKRHGNPRHPIRTKPFVGQPTVGTEEELSGVEFGIELLDLS